MLVEQTHSDDSVAAKNSRESPEEYNMRVSEPKRIRGITASTQQNMCIMSSRAQNPAISGRKSKQPKHMNPAVSEQQLTCMSKWYVLSIVM